jgi:HlyD family secretion protein
MTVQNYWKSIFIAVILCILIASVAVFLTLQSSIPSASASTTTDAQTPTNSAAITVEVTRPRSGGIARVCIQAGTVEPFEMADLYAKASGFLAEQAVDIGSRVQAGDVLARLSVPEYEKQVARDQARVKNAQAKVRQSEAARQSFEAEARAAEAAVGLAKVTVRAKVAYRQYREKQLARIKELAASRAVDARLADEQEDYYQSAVEGENSAKEQVNAAQERVLAAKAKVLQAGADIDDAKASVEVAEADLARSEVLLRYTLIKSPYTGVVTRRNFHPGDFIKSADQGGNMPLLTVERTNKMRVVVQVPDRDVAYVTVGDAATLEIDALPGRLFQGTIARFAEAEDPTTRLMRTEVDIPNPDGKLRRGMYGRATLILQAGTPDSVRIPSAALVERKEGGSGSVRVVKDGKVKLQRVTIGADNGTETEIISGLTATDLVILRSSTPVVEGAEVTTSDSQR